MSRSACSRSASKFLSFESCYAMAEQRCVTHPVLLKQHDVFITTQSCVVCLQPQGSLFYQLHSCRAVDFLVFVIGCCLVSMKSKSAVSVSVSASTGTVSLNKG